MSSDHRPALQKLLDHARRIVQHADHNISFAELQKKTCDAYNLLHWDADISRAKTRIEAFRPEIAALEDALAMYDAIDMRGSFASGFSGPVNIRGDSASIATVRTALHYYEHREAYRDGMIAACAKIAVDGGAVETAFRIRALK